MYIASLDAALILIVFRCSLDIKADTSKIVLNTSDLELGKAYVSSLKVVAFAH